MKSRSGLLERLARRFTDAHVTVSELPDGSTLLSTYDMAGVFGYALPIHVPAPSSSIPRPVAARSDARL